MALQQAGVELVAQGLSGFVSDMGKANKAVSGFGDAGDKAGKTFKSGFGEVVTGALRQVGAIGVEALLKAGQAVAGFVSDSIGLAGDFQSGMQEFQAVAGQDVDAKGLEEFHDLFLQLGKDLPVSTSDVQKAAIEMVKGGIDPATVAAGGLRQNIQFAAAAMGGDLAAAAEVSAKILGGWADANATAADKSEFLTSATDLLTKAANASSVDVHELSLGIFNAQGIAKTAGVSFEDLTTTLAEIAPRFASSSEAGNSLKNVIARLQPTTDGAYQAMQGLGLITKDGSNTFYDATGNFVGFQKASQLLQESLVGLTNQQKQDTLQRIFGNDAMNAASALAELGAEGYQHMADALDKANGVAANAALKQQGYNTALENAKGSVEAFKIQLGERLLPVLTDFLNNAVAPGVNMLGTLTDAFFGNQEAVDALPGPLQTLVGWFKTAHEWVGRNLPPVIKFLSDLWTNTLSPALKEVWGVLQKQVIPIIMDLAGAVLPILGSAISVGASAFKNILLPIITTIWTFFKNNILPILAEVAKWLKDNVPPAVAVLANFLSNTLFPALNKVWAFVDKNLIPILLAVAEILIATVGKAIEIVTALWSNILWPALKAVGKWISDNLGPVLRDFGYWLENVTGGINGVAEAIQGVIRWVKEMADKIRNIKLPDWLTPGSPTPLEIGIRGIGDALKADLNPQIKSLFNTLQVAPPASAAQILIAGGGNTTNNYSRSISMPVYTNMTHGAVTQSGAILNALLP